MGSIPTAPAKTLKFYPKYRQGVYLTKNNLGYKIPILTEKPILTPEDIKNLTEFQKTVFVTKDEFNSAISELKDGFSTLQSSVDAVLKEKVTNEQERTVANRRIKDLENWADKASPKLGIKFEH